MHNKQTIFRSQ